MTIQELRFKNTQILTQADALAKKGFTSETRSQFDAMIEESKVITADIARLEDAELRSGAMRATTAPPRSGFEERSNEQNEQEKRSFLNWMRTGERRDMSSASGGTGLQFVPTTIAAPVTAKLSYGTLLGPDGVSILRTASGNQINIPLINDTGNGLSIVGQTSSATTSIDPTITSVSSNCDTARTLIALSNELLSDSEYDLSAAVNAWINVRFARQFANSISAGNSSNVAALAAAGTTTTSAASGTVTYTDLATLYGSLGVYATTGSWIMSSLTKAYFLGQVSTTGQPILTPDVNGNPFSAILGRPVVIDENRPTVAASHVPVFFGDLKEAYVARLGGFQLKRLEEIASLNNETVFALFARVSGVNTDAGTHPLKSLTVHA